MTFVSPHVQFVVARTLTASSNRVGARRMRPAPRRATHAKRGSPAQIE